ncbi:MAG: succinate dehydrogenase cytochrome b subunit [Verrucomicrobiota bacterium]|nr:succinate dehydrogenase cytochrome b subunit [Verrucomicrobiota bacterium]
MIILTDLFKSSLGKKYIMAITGALMFVFVIAHLIGNLQIFLGREAINRYGYFLQSNLELIWPARIGLLVLIVLHVWAAIKLSAENRAARPVAYTNYHPTAASYASRTMMMSGLIVFCFIIYHLLHFTLQIPSINFTGQNFVNLHDAKNRHDVFAMMVLGFSNLWISFFYIIGVGLLSLHLSHGLSAMFQSLGWKKKSYAPFLENFARVFSIFIFVGYSSIPVAILLGYGKEVLNK